MSSKDLKNVKPKLVIVSAPSGAGKTTLCARLLKDFHKNIALSISSTTRSPRKSETPGKHYYFLTKNDFELKIKSDEFAEWALVHGHYYGTSKETIETIFNTGKSVLLDIDVQGARSLKEKYPNQCVSIFLSPPDLKELENRLRTRGTENEKIIQERIENAKHEISCANEFQHIVINDDLEKAYQKLKSIFKKEVLDSHA